ncbi:MAG: hypothetical protein ACRC7S_01135 [Cetobacterium sp.]
MNTIILGLICAIALIFGMVAIVTSNVIISVVCIIIAIYSICALSSNSFNPVVIIRDILN